MPIFWGVVVLALVLKYPFFEFGPRYAAATGESLVEGYARIGRWAVWLYLFITVRALGRLMEERNPFIRLSGAGLAVLFGLQAFVNMAVAIRLLPAKGMTLPFISYGGSSMLAAAIAMGTLMALTRERPHDAAADFRSKM